MPKIVIYLLILFGVLTLHFTIGITINGFRAQLIQKAKESGAYRHNPWLMVVLEVLIGRNLFRKGIITWIFKKFVDKQGTLVPGASYTFIILGVMGLIFLIFFLRRIHHLGGEFLLALARIPLDLICLASFTIVNQVSKLPPELQYNHVYPVNYATKDVTVTIMRPVGSGAGAPGGGVRMPSSPGSPNYSQPTYTDGYNEPSYADPVTADPIYVPEKYRDDVFVPDGPYYTATTADGQTVNYTDSEYRPFVDGGLDDISYHD